MFATASCARRLLQPGPNRTLHFWDECPGSIQFFMAVAESSHNRMPVIRLCLSVLESRHGRRQRGEWNRARRGRNREEIWLGRKADGDWEGAPPLFCPPSQHRSVFLVHLDFSLLNQWCRSKQTCGGDRALLLGKGTNVP